MIQPGTWTSSQIAEVTEETRLAKAHPPEEIRLLLQISRKKGKPPGSHSTQVFHLHSVGNFHRKASFAALIQETAAHGCQTPRGYHVPRRRSSRCSSPCLCTKVLEVSPIERSSFPPRKLKIKQQRKKPKDLFVSPEKKGHTSTILLSEL